MTTLITPTITEAAVQWIVILCAALTMAFVPLALIGVRWNRARGTEKASPVKEVVREVLYESVHPTTETLTGKASYSAASIGLSMFAGYMGAWVITGPVEVGYMTGMWGVVLYCSACVLPLMFFTIVGPAIRRVSQLYGFSLIDFSGAKFGRGIAVLLNVLAFAILFFGNVSDFTALNGIISVLSSGTSRGWIVADMIIVAVACTIYSILGGFAASIYTDVAQSCIIGLLTIILSSLLTPLQKEASQASMDIATEWNMSGVIAGLVLNISCFLVTYADNSFWQKFYAAKTNKTYTMASLICCTLYIPVIFMFGYFGCIAKAMTLDGIIPEAEWPGNSIFVMVEYLNSPTLTSCVLLMGTLCVMSSVDNRLLASGNLIGQTLSNRGLNLNFTRVLGLGASLIAILVAIYEPATIMQVLYCGNLIGCFTAPVLLMSAWDKSTTVGIWSGVLASILSACIWGWVKLGTFWGGFQWWIFPLGYYETSCLYTFVTANIVAFSTIVSISILDRKVLRKSHFNNLIHEEQFHPPMLNEEEEDLQLHSTAHKDHEVVDEESTSSDIYESYYPQSHVETSKSEALLVSKC